MNLDGTVAMVTGASSGIGAATAAQLARLGASVALVARRTERITDLASQISSSGGGKALAITAPGATATELRSHLRPEIIERQNTRFAGVQIMEATDIAETIAFIVTRPRHVAVNEVLIRPTEQEN